MHSASNRRAPLGPVGLILFAPLLVPLLIVAALVVAMSPRTRRSAPRFRAFAD